MSIDTEGDTRNDSALPSLTRAQVNACAFGSWFPKFKRVTPKATIIPLDNEFIDYLKSDGVYLPDNETSDSGSGSDPNGEEEDDDPEEDEPLRPRYDFSSLSARIQETIDEYDAVFPKLNWSSPQDAAWMVAGPPLKCTSAEDVYLLLKSSDFIAHDLDHAYDDCEDVTEESSKTAPSYHLVLKKYFSMPKSHEFRCFVREGRLQAISQRDSNFYDFLQVQQRQDTFILLISEFFESKILGQFPLADYVFDVYLTRDERKVFLIDFNPYATRTDALLFSWEEIAGLPRTSEHPIFRVVASEAQASQSMPAFSHNRYPKEVVGLSDGASIAEFAEKWRGALAETVLDTSDAKTQSSKGSHVGEVPGR